MKLHTLQPLPGSRVDRKRVGRGTGSGHGKTSGRGHKGQNARSGGGVRPGFEGGQTPLFKRLPKRGFTNINRVEYDIVNVKQLNIFPEGALVNPDELVKAGLVKKNHGLIKILGDGELNVKLTVVANKFTKTAEKRIIDAGGKIEVV
ncbi:MAG: 50S ribosomal protein L15 [Bacilli bacterium]|jgi:large subunit ribosomal protein L15|nr:50S ribosomal protein L15 [Bacillota bacterium]NLM31969.1 50S ribosomal protein L15 [Acholeplasmataceae bacterium]HOA77956.1 50S ribosomal protein L15 [Bacilli bacterium]HPZ26732.1 50S ribosomal protein L15 [Bacilli bacterium]HQC89201.1 50S ribosomal protein L15 [Bacilli bacterium]